MVTENLDISKDIQQRPMLERTLLQFNTEIALYILVIILSTIAHLWGLGTMAMHHDESIHAWSSWNYYTGKGGFNCYDPNPDDNIRPTSASYCYDPVYHGPSLYMLTLTSYFLFGDGDGQARLPMAVAGVLMVASCWMLRPLLGKQGAFIAALLLGFSPSLLYYTRFARHDGLMVLWEVWMVIGVFRYLMSGQARFLYLLSVGTILAVGTHELYYILFFIFGMFVLLRLIAESSLGRASFRLYNTTYSYFGTGLIAMLLVCIALIIVNRPLPIGKGLFLGEKAMLVGTTLFMAWLCQHVWPQEPILLSRLKDLWQSQRNTLWVALAIAIVLFLVMYTNFFSYPRGAIDGLYAGLAYWLGSQHEYARGDQPWYYYMMQLPIYEPLGIVCFIGAAIYLFSHPIVKAIARKNGEEVVGETSSSPEGTEGEEMVKQTASSTSGLKHSIHNDPIVNLFALLLLFWYINSIVIFSWAGEKMPWLLVHMSLPGNLIAAWALGRLVAYLDIAPTMQKIQRTMMLLIPPSVFLLLISLNVAMWRLRSGGEGQEAQSNLLQGLIPLIIGGVLIYSLLTIGQKIGAKVVLSLSALTIATILGAYMVRSTWMVVYHHPDTPIEPLIYTQSSPDVPRYVRDMQELSINLTRNNRTSNDIAGGLSLPIVIDNGDKNGDGSLAWPLQWYFRDFRSISWKKAEDMQNGPKSALEVTLPDGSKSLAPVVMIYKAHITSALRSFLEQNYVQPYGEGGSLNWWFPEGNKCNPEEQGYKRFYFNNWTAKEKLKAKLEKDCGKDISDKVYPPWAPFLWPFKAENWETLKNYLLYRTLPNTLKPGAREMQVWVRRDLLSGIGGSQQSISRGSTMLHLEAKQSFGGPDTLRGPTGVTVGNDGKVYIADTQNHRIQIFDTQGNVEQTIGSFGSGKGQFIEPRGIALDSQSNIYVADTWNARIVKLNAKGEWLKTWGIGEKDIGNGHMATITGGTQQANAANPLGFFGPRGIALDAKNNVYIADTGNRRIVVTDNEGNFLYQWGYAGAEPGQFNEPTAVGVDMSGNVYVADTWNGRVQIFPPGTDGKVSSTPSVTWDISAWQANTYDDPSLGISADGKVYVSVPSQNYVLAANMRGDVFLRWGGAGNDTASLNSPSGIATDTNGDVYVVDRASHQVLRFEVPNVKPEARE